MPVLIEAISVLVSVATLERCYPGGWESYHRMAPNQTLCCDGQLTRVGFMVPDDVEAFINNLERIGLVFMLNGAATDIAVADQQRGLTVPSDWVECGQATIGAHPIMAARLSGSEVMTVATPVAWH